MNILFLVFLKFRRKEKVEGLDSKFITITLCNVLHNSKKELEQFSQLRKDLQVLKPHPYFSTIL